MPCSRTMPPSDAGALRDGRLGGPGNFTANYGTGYERCLTLVRTGRVIAVANVYLPERVGTW